MCSKSAKDLLGKSALVCMACEITIVEHPHTRLRLFVTE